LENQTDHDFLAARFEENRTHLRAVAYRMLGSLAEADDAVQESWLRLSRSDSNAIENLGGWLTTVVARVSLDMLRSRESRREDPIVAIDAGPEPSAATHASPRPDPEQEALMADSVGLALLVVLDRLDPAERLAFVLHDVFAMPFDEIAPIVNRTPAAARQLASRARRRVQGGDPASVASSRVSQHNAQRETVQAFLTALRAGDFQGLMAVLAPDVVVRLDEAAVRPGAPREIVGAENWARGAVAFSQMARGAVQPALINGSSGLIWAPNGRLRRALTLTVVDGKITRCDVIASPATLRDLDFAILT
jgi:RNA polymerase sigma-70 factor (ECF subfamily)